MTRIELPEFALILLVGASGSGKSTFARRHFGPTEVLSSDFFRAMVRNDESDQSASADAFAVLHFVLRKRLAARCLTVVDATNVQARARRPLLDIGRELHCPVVAIVFDLPTELSVERNRERPRDVGAAVVERQRESLRSSLAGMATEGFAAIHVLTTPEDVEQAIIVRASAGTGQSNAMGPFDIIGDVHGCFDELTALLETLGYGITSQENGTYIVGHPDGRRVVFVGDLVDRGPGIAKTLQLGMDMVASGVALCVPGNHEMKLLRKLRGSNVQITHGLAETLAALDAQPESFREQVAGFIDGLPIHLVLDDGQLVVAHAGLKEAMHGKTSRGVRAFALFGETTGETDAYGLPVRGNWAAAYHGKASVVYGHTPVLEAEWLNRTINIDTGCVFGGKLTALRYPEGELVSVPAARVYYEPVRPLHSA